MSLNCQILRSMQIIENTTIFTELMYPGYRKAHLVWLSILEFIFASFISRSKKHNGTNVTAPDAYFDNKCLFGDSRCQNKMARKSPPPCASVLNINGQFRSLSP